VSTRRFSLVKWYLDCVTECGDTAIVYCARLNWRGPAVAIASVLTTHGSEVETRSSISGFRLTCNGGEIVAEHSRLQIAGNWRSEAVPVERVPYETSSGFVHWNCVQPRSLVTLRVAGREMTGLGYAECLTLTLPPWRLPLRRLRWGRFVSATDCLVWIDWEGEHSTRIAILNGLESKVDSVSDTEIALGQGSLRMEDSVTLRRGELGATILPGAPALSKIFPRSLFSVKEQKWRSRGTLSGPDSSSTGWVIHEVVDWKP